MSIRVTSFLRGRKPTHRTACREKYIIRSKIFQSKIHKGTGDGNSSLEQRELEKIFSV